MATGTIPLSGAMNAMAAHNPSAQSQVSLYEQTQAQAASKRNQDYRAQEHLWSTQKSVNMMITGTAPVNGLLSLSSGSVTMPEVTLAKFNDNNFISDLTVTVETVEKMDLVMALTIINGAAGVLYKAVPAISQEHWSLAIVKMLTLHPLPSLSHQIAMVTNSKALKGHQHKKGLISIGGKDTVFHIGAVVTAMKNIYIELTDDKTPINILSVTAYGILPVHADLLRRKLISHQWDVVDGAVSLQDFATGFRASVLLPGLTDAQKQRLIANLEKERPASKDIMSMYRTESIDRRIQMISTRPGDPVSWSSLASLTYKDDRMPISLKLLMGYKGNKNIKSKIKCRSNLFDIDFDNEPANDNMVMDHINGITEYADPKYKDLVIEIFGAFTAQPAPPVQNQLP